MTKDQWEQIRYFRPEEFDSPGVPGSGLAMAYPFMLKLDQVRELCGFPFYINSGVRTPEHNAEVGGVDSSAHEVDANGDAWACDINIYHRVPGVVTYRRAMIVKMAFKCEINRVGEGDYFVHLDADPSKPTPRLWHY